MVFISNAKKLHVSAYSGHLQVLTTFLLKEFYMICLNRVVDTSTWTLLFSTFSSSVTSNSYSHYSRSAKRLTAPRRPIQLLLIKTKCAKLTHTHTHTHTRTHTRTQSKTLEADQPPAENKKFRRIRRRCQTNQSRNPPHIRAYKIPHLKSQFPPNPTPTQPERSTPSYIQIHWPNRHPVKFSLTKARNTMVRSQHHHAV